MGELSLNFISSPSLLVHILKIVLIYFSMHVSPLPCLFSSMDNHCIQFKQNDHVAVNGLYDPYVLQR